MKHAMNQWIVVSLGGSLLVPKTGIDTTFLKGFKQLVQRLLTDGLRLVVIVGGGRTARDYQQAAAALGPLPADDLDWLGIHATRLNAHLLRTVLKAEAYPRLITDPEGDELPGDARFIVGAGWKPGWSTDYDAAIIARRLGAARIVNVSNVDYVYDEDPRTSAKAIRFETMSWPALRRIIGDTWSPGLNVPFDPVAARLCERERLEVAIVSGADLANVEHAIRGDQFRGTVVKG
jgi:uridylate kinase